MANKGENTKRPTLFFTFEFDDAFADIIEAKGRCWFARVRSPTGDVYPVSFEDAGSARQETEYVFAETGQHAMAYAPGMIVVHAVTREMMERAVQVAWDSGFFNYLKPLGEDGLRQWDEDQVRPTDPATMLAPQPTLLLTEDLNDQLAHEIKAKGKCGFARVRSPTGEVYPLTIMDGEAVLRAVGATRDDGSPGIVCEPGLIVVHVVTREIMEEAVRAAWIAGLFRYLQPLDENGLPR